MLGLSCGIWYLAHGLGIEPRTPGLGARSLSHWTTRGVSASGCFTDFYGCHISANKNSECPVKFQCQISQKKKKKCKYIPWNIWGHSYTKLFLVVYLKFKLNWTVCVLPEQRRRQINTQILFLLSSDHLWYHLWAESTKTTARCWGKGWWWVRRGERGGLSCFLPLHVSPWALGQALSVPLSLPN